MKLALALLVLAASLPAHAATNQKVIVNVVVTLVPSSTTTSTTTPVTTPTPVTTTPVVSTPVVSTPVVSTPTPVTSTPTSSVCVNNYPAAVSSMAAVTTNLVQAEQLVATALSQKTISTSAYASAIKTLSLVNVDNSDVRDLIRMDGPTSLIAQNITFVSAEIGTLPGLLGTTSQLKSSLTTLTTSMQSSLGTASTDVTQSTCPQSVP